MVNKQYSILLKGNNIVEVNIKRKDKQKYGEYRTKRVILEIYDAMTDSIRIGTPYQTLLDPPPR